MNICMVVSYDGSRFAGWQKNVNTGRKRSLQTVFEEILSDYFSQEVRVHAAGRTDAGVNAVGQVFNFHLSGKGSDGVKFSEMGKTYEYYFDEGERANVFARAYAFPVGHTLDLFAMREAAGYLVGTHDFSMFSSVRVKKDRGLLGQSDRIPGVERDTVRTISDISVERVGIKHPSCNLVRVSVTGDGFLYHMVRILSGTLYEVGCKTRKAENVRELLECGARSDSGVLLPGNALFLRRVYYKEKVLLTKLLEGV